MKKSFFIGVTSFGVSFIGVGALFYFLNRESGYDSEDVSLCAFIIIAGASVTFISLLSTRQIANDREVLFSQKLNEFKERELVLIKDMLDSPHADWFLERQDIPLLVQQIVNTCPGFLIEIRFASKITYFLKRRFEDLLEEGKLPLGGIRSILSKLGFEGVEKKSPYLQEVETKIVKVCGGIITKAAEKEYAIISRTEDLNQISTYLHDLQKSRFLSRHFNLAEHLSDGEKLPEKN